MKNNIHLDFVCIALYKKTITDFTLLQIEKLYPKSKIYIITKKSDFKIFKEIGIQNLQLIDEDSVIPNFDFKNFSDYLQKNQLFHSKGCGWIWQIFLKLHTYLLESLPKQFILIDADLILLKRIPFFDGDKFLFNRNIFEDYYHKLYLCRNKHDFFRISTSQYRFGLFVKTILNIEKYSPEYISEYMLYDKDYVRKMFDYIQNHFHLNFIDVCFSIIKKTKCLPAEYALYTHYIKHFHPEKFQSTTLRYFRNGSDLYGMKVTKPILKIFEEIWQVDMVSFETWQIYAAPKFWLRVMAHLRYKLNFYQRIRFLTIHTKEKPIRLYKNKILSYMRFLKIFGFFFYLNLFLIKLPKEIFSHLRYQGIKKTFQKFVQTILGKS